MFKNLKLIQKIVLLAAIIIVINLVLQFNFILTLRTKDIKAAEENALSDVKWQASLYEDEFKRIENLVKGFAQEFGQLIDSKELSRETAIKILSESLKQNPSIVGHGLGFEKNAFDGSDATYSGNSRLGADAQGRFLPYVALNGTTVAVEPLTGYDVPGDGDWYLVPKNTGEPIVTDPYLYPVNGEDVLMFTIAYPVKSGNRFIGVVTADIALSQVEGSLKADTEKATFDLQSTMLTLSGNVIGTTLDTVRADASIGENAIFKDKASLGDASVHFSSVPWVEGKQLVALAPIKFNSSSNQWFILNLTPEKQILAEYKANLWVNIIIIVVALVIITMVVFLIQKSINRPMKKLLSVIETVDQGDLREVSNLGTRDELGVLSKNFDHMIENMKKLIYNVQNSSNVVGESAEKMTSVTHQSARAITNANMALSQISEAHSKQSEDIEEIVQKTSLLSALISDTTTLIDEVSEISEKTQDVSNKGILILNDLNDKTVDTMDKSQEISSAVREVNQSVASINGITTIIDDIATQTNLLALNASIEAARAGEAGRGFAVVADEIRKLAVQTSTATADISKVIHDVAFKASAAATSVEEVSKAQQKQFESIESSSSIFKEINASFTTLKNKINAVDEKALVIERSKSEILDAVTNISAVSEETTASTEETTSMMNEQKQMMDELSEYSDALNAVTQELLNYIRAFKVE